MLWLDFLVLVLASGAVIDVWFNGSLFAGLRSLLEARQDRLFSDEDETESGAAEPLPVAMQFADWLIPAWATDPLLCPFCLSYHVPAWLLVLMLPTYLPSLTFWLTVLAVAGLTAGAFLFGVMLAEMDALCVFLSSKSLQRLRVVAAALLGLGTVFWFLSYRVAGVSLPPEVGLFCRLPLYALAVTRLGNIINKALPAESRYERSTS